MLILIISSYAFIFQKRICATGHYIIYCCTSLSIAFTSVVKAKPERRSGKRSSIETAHRRDS